MHQRKTRIGFLQQLAHDWSVDVRAVAEIGVLRGKFSRRLYTGFPGADLYLIDPWGHIPELAASKGQLHMKGGNAEANQAWWDSTFASVQARFGGDPRVRFMRMVSARAAPAFRDESLDIAYIDADHRYEKVIEDINLWMPKVKRGAILCGHDYVESRPRRGLYKVLPAVNDRLEVKNIVIGPNTMWAWRKP